MEIVTVAGLVKMVGFDTYTDSIPRFLLKHGFDDNGNAILNKIEYAAFRLPTPVDEGSTDPDYFSVKVVRETAETKSVPDLPFNFDSLSHFILVETADLLDKLPVSYHFDHAFDPIRRDSIAKIALRKLQTGQTSGLKLFHFRKHWYMVSSRSLHYIGYSHNNLHSGGVFLIDPRGILKVKFNDAD